MRLVSILFIIIQFNSIIEAQQLSKFDFTVGYGFYEGYNVGGEYFFNSNKRSVSLSVGYDQLIHKKQESIALTFSYNIALFKNKRIDSTNFKWHLNNKAVLWQLEDEYYVFRAVSLIPSLNRMFVLYKKMRLSLDIGPSFNIVLYNKRKTYKEVGWPYHVMPDFRILFIF